MIKKTHICRCGGTAKSMKSYFHKIEGMRVTVCDKCAQQYGLTDKETWNSSNYTDLKEEQKKTPDAINN